MKLWAAITTAPFLTAALGDSRLCILLPRLFSFVLTPMEPLQFLSVMLAKLPSSILDSSQSILGQLESLGRSQLQKGRDRGIVDVRMQDRRVNLINSHHTIVHLLRAVGGCVNSQPVCRGSLGGGGGAVVSGVIAGSFLLADDTEPGFGVEDSRVAPADEEAVVAEDEVGVVASEGSGVMYRHGFDRVVDWLVDWFVGWLIRVMGCMSCN
jgi:hypothetical protein